MSTNYSAALDALDGAGDDLALFLAVFSEDRGLFSLADLLDDDLFCGLGGDASVVAFDLEGKMISSPMAASFFILFASARKMLMLGVM